VLAIDIVVHASSTGYSVAGILGLENIMGSQINPATSDHQATEDSYLSTIATNTTGGLSGNVGIKNTGGSQIDPATSGNQSTANSYLSTIATNTTGGLSGAVNIKNTGGSNIDPATSGNQTTELSDLATIATNQADVHASGSAALGTLNATYGVTLDHAGTTSISVSATTWNGAILTIESEGADGSTWNTKTCGNSTSNYSTITANGNYICKTAGDRALRLRVSTGGSPGATSASIAYDATPVVAYIELSKPQNFLMSDGADIVEGATTDGVCSNSAAPCTNHALLAEIEQDFHSSAAQAVKGDVADYGSPGPASVQVSCVYGPTTGTSGQKIPLNCADNAGDLGVSVQNTPAVTCSACAKDTTATNEQGTEGGGSAPSKFKLVGGAYHSSPITLTNGQAAEFQFDSRGDVNIDCGGSTCGKDSSLTSILTALGSSVMQNTGGTVQTVPGTSGGLSVKSYIVANNTTSVAIDASAGQVYAVTGYAIHASQPIWLKLYDAAAPSVTCGSGTPKERHLISTASTGAGLVLPIGSGVPYATAITGCAVQGIADNDATAPAASSYVVNVYYK
jgi:hypothetical protein